MLASIIRTGKCAIGPSVFAHGFTAAPWPTAADLVRSRIPGTRWRAPSAQKCGEVRRHFTLGHSGAP